MPTMPNTHPTPTTLINRVLARLLYEVTERGGHYNARTVRLAMEDEVPRWLVERGEMTERERIGRQAKAPKLEVPE